MAESELEKLIKSKQEKSRKRQKPNRVIIFVGLLTITMFIALVFKQPLFLLVLLALVLLSGIRELIEWVG
ncbi:hypothetical protein B7O87_04750 [Cylindrospermopsis raciborskii CENA303]|uniref:Uncharacterized protein n=1 Tax=Cylindrospermopsis raciborskii CENA303 TaxID=1170769 RepID=A0A1X4GAF7_9CYAN|nr:hypothetical protein B7O87_04750 [Cylindrospermopsis raciborskii CENA303]